MYIKYTSVKKKVHVWRTEVATSNCYDSDDDQKHMEWDDCSSGQWDTFRMKIISQILKLSWIMWLSANIIFYDDSKQHILFLKFYNNLSGKSDTKLNCMGYRK